MASAAPAWGQMLVDLLVRVQLDTAKLDQAEWPAAKLQQYHEAPAAALAVLIRCSAVSRHWREAAQRAAGQLSGFRVPVQHASPLLGSWASGWPHLRLAFPSHQADAARLAHFLQSCSGLRRMTLTGSWDMSLEDAERMQQAAAGVSGLHELELSSFKPTSACPASLRKLTIGPHPEYTAPELVALLERLQGMKRLSELTLELGASEVCFPAAALSHIHLPLLCSFTVQLEVATGKQELSWFACPSRTFELCLCVTMDTSSDSLLAFSQQAASVLRWGDQLLLPECWRVCRAAQRAVASISGPLAYFYLCVEVQQIVALPRAPIVRLVMWGHSSGPEVLVSMRWDLLAQQLRRVEISFSASLAKTPVVFSVTGYDGRMPERGPWQLGIAGARAVQGLPVVKSGKDLVLRNKAAEQRGWKYDAENWNW